MNNIKKIIALLLLCTFLLSGCSDASNDEENVVENTEYIQTEEVSEIDLVVNPSVEYIVAGLSQVESVIRIEKDPNGGQGDNVVATVYFSSDIVDQNKFDENETTSEKGTQSGGSIDIFTNEEDAVARDKYLSKFDGKWVFDSGSHTVLGTVVIRTSSLLDEEDQALLTSQISEVLTSGDITEDMVEEASKKLQEDERLRQEAEEKERQEKEKIKVGANSSDLKNINFEDAIEKLDNSGFTNITSLYEIVDCGEEKDGKTVKVSINGIESFNKSDKFLPTDEIIVYYYKAKKVTPPDIWYNLLERHYEEIENLFIESGFTNVITKAHEVDYSENSFEGSVVNICIGEDNVTYEATEEFYPSVQVRIDYRVKPKSVIEPTNTLSEEDNKDEENPYPALNSYSVYTKQEYAHYDSDVVRLGNNETVWITISASPATLTADDFYFEYDDTMLNIVDISEEVNGNDKEIKLSIRAKKAGVSEILIASLYEIYEYYDEASCYTIVINGLDQNEGRVVYVASTGEKYHYSSNCISSGIKTTLDDAVTLEYDPCGKCVG